MNPRHVLRLARLDLALLWRNRTGLLTVLGVPAFFATMLLVSRNNGNTTAGLDAVVYTGTGDLAFFLLFAVFINLTAVYTARREDLSLKRLRGSALSEAEILGGSVLSAGIVYLVMAGIVIVILATMLGAGPPANPLLLATGMLLGLAVFALLGFALAGVTPTAELAQWTVTPLLLLCMAGSGFMVPLDGLPDPVARAAAVLPMTPVVEIVRTAYLGRNFTYGGDGESVGFLESWAEAGLALLILMVWIGAGLALTRRYLRWEPRRV